MKLDGCTVAITGASVGFGAAMARSFAQEGARLVLIARREPALRALAKELGEDGAYVLPCDIGDVTRYTEALGKLPEPFAGIDVLINNAGIALSRDPAHKSSLDDWMSTIDVNIRGLVAGTHAVLPGMVARGHGHIVNLGSTAGMFPNAGNIIYGPSKAFVRQFSFNLRADLLGQPIRVTEIEPGVVAGTEFSSVRYKGDEKAAAAFYEGLTPLTAEDVAECVLWAVARPAHVNINTIQLMPVDQAFGPPALHRRKG